MKSVNAFLEELNGRVKDDLSTPLEIVDYDEFPNVRSLKLEKRQWVRLQNVVAVVVDLKGSTKLDFKRNARTSGRLYEAVTGNCVRIANTFQAQFVDIQGDGLFALYHGERAYERAMCAGITLESFSTRCVVPRVGDSDDLDERFPKKDIGLKVGMSAGVLAVKKVGMRGDELNEPVWAGRPVNWAAKCAQKADANELIAAEPVYSKFEQNDFVRYSCGCDGQGSTAVTPSDLWDHVPVETIPDDTVRCMRLTSSWCMYHGDEFCSAIVDGKTTREDLEGLR